MFLSKLFKKKSARLITIMGCLAMALGVSATISSFVSTASDSEVVETKASGPYTLYVVSGNDNWLSWNNRFKVGDGSNWSNPTTSPVDSDFARYSNTSNFNQAKIGGTTRQFQKITISDLNSGNWITVQKYNSAGSSWEANGYNYDGQDYISSANNIVNGSNNVLYVQEYSGRPWIKDLWSISGWFYKIKTMKKLGDASAVAMGCDLYKSGSTSVDHDSVSGYNFDGWYTNAACTTPWGGSVTADATLYAKYTVVPSYTIDAKVWKDGAAVSTSSQTKNEGETYTVPSLPGTNYYGYATPTKWSTNSDGTGTLYSAGDTFTVSSSTPTTLYAVYVATGTVTYYVNVNAYADDFGSVYVYCWDSNGENNVWPGTEGTKVAGPYAAYNIWSFTVHIGDVFIINNGSGSTYSDPNQTVQYKQSGVSSGYVLVLGATRGQEDKSCYCGPWEAYDPTSYPTVGYYLVGTHTSWAFDSDFLMTNAAAGSDDLAYITEVEIEENDQVKIRKYVNGHTTADSWTQQTGLDKETDVYFSSADLFWGCSDLGTTYTFIENVSENIKFKKSGVFAFYLNKKGKIWIVDDTIKAQAGCLYIPYSSEDTIKINSFDSDDGAIISNQSIWTSIPDYRTTTTVTFDGVSKLSKVPLYDLRGTGSTPAATFQIYDGSSWSAVLTVPSPGETVADAPHIYWKSGYSLVSEPMGAAAHAIYEMDLAIQNSENNWSVCELDSSEWSRLHNLYTAGITALSEDEISTSVLSDATIKTYPTGVDKETAISAGSHTTSVKLSAIDSMLQNLISGGSSVRYVGPVSQESPLTATLWIVLGCGLAGLSAIGVAYFVSKKKKRPQA